MSDEQQVLRSRHGWTPATVVDFIDRAHGELKCAYDCVTHGMPEAAWLHVGTAKAILLGLVADHAVPQPKEEE